MITGARNQLTIGAGALLACAMAAAATAQQAPAAAGPAPLPERLADTGLYADFDRGELHAEALPFAPQYPLWSDGAAKRRWIRLPAGAAIDGRDPDVWVFPVGTRLWKEFSFGGRPFETRYMERAAEGWRYATYAWTADGRDARLAPQRGGRATGADGRTHDLPSGADCRACHEGHPAAVLGFGALQLSPDRDPLAPHAAPPPAGAVDLPALIDRGLLRGAPPSLRSLPPRIAAATPTARAALGYLHGNCAGCHNARGPLSDLGLDLEQRVGAPPNTAPGAPRETAVGVPSRFQRAGATLRIAPGDPARSVLVRRLAATDPVTQMPPLGRSQADAEAEQLVAAWIREGPTAAAPTRSPPREKNP
ncbi:MAG: hypothetical protein QM767_04560 [Anaeromyxobacter sp.]